MAAKKKKKPSLWSRLTAPRTYSPKTKKWKTKANPKKAELLPAKVLIGPNGKMRVFVTAGAARRLKKNPSSGYKVAKIPGYRSYAIYRVGDTPSTKNWVSGPFRSKKEALKRLKSW